MKKLKDLKFKAYFWSRKRTFDQERDFNILLCNFRREIIMLGEIL